MPSKASHAINGVLSGIGLEVRRKDRLLPSDGYYPTVATCQIPHMGSIFESFFGRRAEGTFVEVGAYDGYTYSNTWGLAERGWNGVMFEPVAEFAEQCRGRHARHPGVQIVETAVSAKPGTLALTVGGPFTTADVGQADEFRQQSWAQSEITNRVVEQQCVTLDSALDRAAIQSEFDVLVVDVEGHEESVFSGFTLGKWLPKMMIVELQDMHPTLVGMRDPHSRLYTRLLETGYVAVFKDAINTILVREELYRDRCAL